MAVEQNRRAPVLDLSRPTAVAVEIDVAEAAEVLMSICAVADRNDHDTFDLGAEWLQARLESVPGRRPRTDVETLRLGDMKVAAHLLGIVYETPKPRTFAAFMERLEAIDPVELKLHLFGHYDTTSTTTSRPTSSRRPHMATRRRSSGCSRRSPSGRTSTSSIEICCGWTASR